MHSFTWLDKPNGSRVINADPGTSEIWRHPTVGSDKFLGLIAVHGDATSAVERWLVFNDGAVSTAGGAPELLAFPAGLAPHWAANPYDKDVLLRDSTGAMGIDLHSAAYATWAAFRAAAQDALEQELCAAPGCLDGKLRGFDATWQRLTLVAGGQPANPPPGNAYTFALRADQHGASMRVLTVKNASGALVGRVYAEAPNGDTRVVHQVAGPHGIIDDQGGWTRYAHAHDGQETLAEFLSDAIGRQGDGWFYTRGVVTHLPTG